MAKVTILNYQSETAYGYIDYKEKSKGIFEVEIVMSTEFIQDLCQRLLTLEKSLSKGIRL